MFSRNIRNIFRSNYRSLQVFSLSGLSLISLCIVKNNFENKSKVLMSKHQGQQKPIIKYSEFDINQDDDKYNIYIVDYGQFHPDLQESLSEQIDIIKKNADELLFNKRKQRKIQIKIIDSNNQYQKKSFEDKYNVKIDKDSFIFLKNGRNQKISDYSFKKYNQDQMEFIFKYFNKPIVVTDKNIDQFLGNKFDSQLTIIAIKNIKDILHNEKIYKQIKEKVYMNFYNDIYRDNILMIQVKENKAAELLGLDLNQNGDIVIIKKNSKKNISKDQVIVQGKPRFQKQMVQNIIDIENFTQFYSSISEAHKRLSIFQEPGMKGPNKDYEIILEVDKNKINQHEIRYLFNTLGQLKKQNIEKKNIEFKLVQNKLENESYKIIVKNNKEFYKNYDMSEHTYNNTFEYLFSNRVDVKNLQNFLDTIISNDVPPFDQHFKSQNPNEKQFVSKKIVSANFYDSIINNSKDQAIMFYSKQCHGCKIAGNQIEKIAKEALIKQSPITFNRMDSDLNKLDCFTNFSYTPVIMMFKGDYKFQPYFYRSNTVKKQQLYNFFNITQQFQIFDYQIYEDAIKSNQKNQKLIKNMLEQIQIQ